jgi:hypothetical protein
LHYAIGLTCCLKPTISPSAQIKSLVKVIKPNAVPGPRSLEYHRTLGESTSEYSKVLHLCQDIDSKLVIHERQRVSCKRRNVLHGFLNSSNAPDIHPSTAPKIKFSLMWYSASTSQLLHWSTERAASGHSARCRTACFCISNAERVTSPPGRRSATVRESAGSIFPVYFCHTCDLPRVPVRGCCKCDAGVLVPTATVPGLPDRGLVGTVATRRIDGWYLPLCPGVRWSDVAGSLPMVGLLMQWCVNGTVHNSQGCAQFRAGGRRWVSMPFVSRRRYLCRSRSWVSPTVWHHMFVPLQRLVQQDGSSLSAPHGCLLRLHIGNAEMLRSPTGYSFNFKLDIVRSSNIPSNRDKSLGNRMKQIDLFLVSSPEFHTNNSPCWNLSG